LNTYVHCVAKVMGEVMIGTIGPMMTLMMMHLMYSRKNSVPIAGDAFTTMMHVVIYSITVKHVEIV